MDRANKTVIHKAHIDDGDNLHIWCTNGHELVVSESTGRIILCNHSLEEYRSLRTMAALFYGNQGTVEELLSLEPCLAAMHILTLTIKQGSSYLLTEHVWPSRYVTIILMAPPMHRAIMTATNRHVRRMRDRVSKHDSLEDSLQERIKDRVVEACVSTMAETGLRLRAHASYGPPYAGCSQIHVDLHWYLSVYRAGLANIGGTFVLQVRGPCLQVRGPYLDTGGAPPDAESATPGTENVTPDTESVTPDIESTALGTESALCVTCIGRGSSEMQHLYIGRYIKGERRVRVCHNYACDMHMRSRA